MNTKTFSHFMLYGIFGALTTILSWVLYWLGTRILGLRPVSASVLAWVLAVMFSYFTSRKYVFHSEARGLRAVIGEYASFAGSRLGTGIFDLIVTWLAVDVMGFYDMPVKIISNILVIILNYIASRILVFKEGM